MVNYYKRENVKIIETPEIKHSLAEGTLDNVFFLLKQDVVLEVQDLFLAEPFEPPCNETRLEAVPVLFQENGVCCLHTRKSFPALFTLRFREIIL